jgi:hypothetical protein
MKCVHCIFLFDDNGWKSVNSYCKQVDSGFNRQNCLDVYCSGADPNVRERDIYASRPIDIAVIHDDAEAIEVLLLFVIANNSSIFSMQVLHAYGASLDGSKSMFHLSPLTEAFSRGYFDIFRLLLELGVKPEMQVDRGMCRSFGSRLFETGIKGRRHFIQLLYDHGKHISVQFTNIALKIHRW